MKNSLERILAGTACWAVLCAAPARAQEPPASAPEAKLQPVETPEVQEPMPESRDLQDVEELGARFRSKIHPGDPLHIVGNDAEGNELRARTPALAHGTHEPAQVDTDANYQRALAMYGEGTVFHTPLPRAPGTEPEPLVPRNPRAHPRHRTPIVEDANPPARGPAAAPWSVLAGLAVSGLLLAWFFVRVRPSLMAPNDVAPPEPQPFVWNPTRRPKQTLTMPHVEAQAPLPRSPALSPGGVRLAARPKLR
jgi:hypothetical protein